MRRLGADFAPLAGRGLKLSPLREKTLHAPFRPARGARIETWLSTVTTAMRLHFAPLAGRGLKLCLKLSDYSLSRFRPARGARIETLSEIERLQLEQISPRSRGAD